MKAAEEYKPWSLAEEDKDDVFGLKEEGVREIGESSVTGTSVDDVESERIEEANRLKREEQELTTLLKGTFYNLQQNIKFQILLLLLLFFKLCTKHEFMD